MRKPTFWYPTWSDTNQAVQLQKLARDLKYQIHKVEGLNYLCSENKGADQLHGHHEADLRFRIYAKCCFFFMTRLILLCQLYKSVCGSRVMRNPDFCICENKGASQLRSAFVFATKKEQSVYKASNCHKSWQNQYPAIEAKMGNN